MKESTKPFYERTLEWDASELPVAADILVYTEEEWRAMAGRSRFHGVVSETAVWVWERPDQGEG